MKLVRYTSDICPPIVIYNFFSYLFPKKYYKSQSLRQFKNSRKFHSSANFSVANAQGKSKAPKLPIKKSPYGGAYLGITSYEFLQPYFSTDKSKIDPSGEFQYVDHVNDVGVLSYPEGEYIHVNIPIASLFEILPVTKARKIASMHGIFGGSRCNAAQLRACTENHSCLVCSTHLTIFSPKKNAAQMAYDRLVKSRNKLREGKIQKKSMLGPKMPKTHSKHEAELITEFPPDIMDDNLAHTILSSACNKMLPKNFEEAGCAVCGELKPLRNMSRLKTIKNLLHVLSSSGVTRIEQKEEGSPAREYTGPVLDYSCSHVCDNCRSTIRKGKVPRLALANGLWLGKVPEELKSLRFVEKLLIAKVRHTCSYVKVASGMQKMKANIIAFESPIPKIYN
ncbi:hypothetical protein BYT27DRAFT_7123602, partial [Phlegmacium glaucopus]